MSPTLTVKKVAQQSLQFNSSSVVTLHNIVTVYGHKHMHEKQPAHSMKKCELRQWVDKCGALISPNAYWQEHTIGKILDMEQESAFSVNVFCLSE